jgi:hypothetical protein
VSVATSVDTDKDVDGDDDDDDQFRTRLASLTLSTPAAPPKSEEQGVDLEPLSASVLSRQSIIAYSEADSIEDDDSDLGDETIVCRIKLKEERAASFQDLLCHIYPRLECLISWANAGDL